MTPVETIKLIAAEIGCKSDDEAVVLAEAYVELCRRRGESKGTKTVAERLQAENASLREMLAEKRKK